MTQTPAAGDAFGCALLGLVAGKRNPVVIERDDGFVSVDGFDYVNGTDERDQWVADRAAGRVLGVRAGAGRGCPALQEGGQEVVALDVSPGAARACRQLGVRHVYEGSVQRAAAGELAGRCDSVMLLGNNLSLVGTCLDPHQTESEEHLAYQALNRRRGRLPGQPGIRVRYQRIATGWFDWLTLSPDELARPRRGRATATATPSASGSSRSAVAGAVLPRRAWPEGRFGRSGHLGCGQPDADGVAGPDHLCFTVLALNCGLG